VHGIEQIRAGRKTSASSLRFTHCIGGKLKPSLLAPCILDIWIFLKQRERTDLALTHAF
jgi:hypothetical protein